MNIQEQQERIIESIKRELSEADEFYKPQGMWHSVWFLPEAGEFMYADSLIRHEVIKPLILDNRLIYVGIEKHQGELMPRYVLANG